MKSIQFYVLPEWQDVDTIDDLNDKYGGLKSAEKVFGDSSISSLLNVYKFSFSSNLDIYSIASDYSNESSVVYSEPNYLFNLSYPQPPAPKLIPNDPFFNNQWHLNNIGQFIIKWNYK
jgi:hypothetical protein